MIRTKYDSGVHVPALGPNLRFFDFFAGAGLATLGLSRSWKCVWANDIDYKKAEVYKKNFKGNHYFVGDVVSFTGNDLPSDAQLAWASFPCQDLSLAGWRRGISADRSGAFWAFWRIMRDKAQAGCRPPIIVIENVLGLLYGYSNGPGEGREGAGDSFTGLCEALAALGLQFGGLVMDARRFVPQSRARVFVVAVDCRIDVSRFACSAPADLWAAPSLLSAYQRLPDNLKSLWRWWHVPEPPRRRVTLSDVIEDDPIGVQWHTKNETDYLLSLMSRANLMKVDHACRAGGKHIGFLYRRIRQGVQRAEVRFDGMSGCLRTPQGGSSRQTVVVVENGTVRTRLLSPREAARLMGAPDWFKLPNNYNDAYRAMGDAVAAPVVRWLSDTLLVPIAEVGGRIPINGNAKASRLLLESAEKRASEWTMEAKRSEMKHLERKTLSIMQKWFAAEEKRKKTDSDVYIVCAGLAVLQSLKRSFPIHRADYMTEGNQVKTGGPFIQRILAEFGEARPYTREGGRTTRGTVPAATRLVEQLNQMKELAAITRESRGTLAKALQRWLYENGVLPYFKRQTLEIEVSLDKPGPQIIADIIQLAGSRNQGGCVAQHLVGAKLCLRLGQEIPNHSCTTADHQLGRSGDFQVKDTIIHVTIAPQSGVIQKCEANVKAGYRPLLLVPEDRLEGARQLLEGSGLERRIAQSMEQWMGQNVEEIGGFAKEQLPQSMRALLEKYNQRVDAVETDKSLMIRIPENL
ncbi:MAG TPA: DUF4928 family protein [Terriglobia bacterium]|nr:DUF4928 family protein [Terriglobia bacterium]